MLSVVVPVYNEERSVELLYDEVAAALDPLGHEWEAVFVDDGSTDGSFAALTRLHARAPNVRVVRLRRNFGKAAALSAGFAQASRRHRSRPSTPTGRTTRPSSRGCSRSSTRATTSSRDGRSVAATRGAGAFVSRIFNAVTGWISGVRLHDMNCGFKAYRAEVVRGLPLYGELHRFIPVLAHERGYRVTELAVNHRPREHGRSRYGIERYLRGFFDLITVTFMGRYGTGRCISSAGSGSRSEGSGSSICMYLTVLWFAGNAIGHRPLLTLGVLLVVVGMQFLSLGLIGEMITTHHEERALERGRDEARVDEILS